MMIYNDAWGIETAGWAMDDSDEALTLYPADVEAALQITDFSEETGEIDHDELREFAVKSVPEGTELTDVVCGVFTGFYGEFSDDEGFWRHWWLSNGAQHVLVKYNCDEEYREDHRAVVDWMLGSLSKSEEGAAD